MNTERPSQGEDSRPGHTGGWRGGRITNGPSYREEVLGLAPKGDLIANCETPPGPDSAPVGTNDTKPGHTPGPWEVVGNPPTEIGAMMGTPDAIIVADTRLMHGTPTARQLADARLIAAAPDLLEALAWAVEQTDAFADGGRRGNLSKDWREWADRARAALQAARPVEGSDQ